MIYELVYMYWHSNYEDSWLNFCYDKRWTQAEMSGWPFLGDLNNMVSDGFAWGNIYGKLFLEPMMTNFTDAYRHHQDPMG